MSELKNAAYIVALGLGSMLGKAQAQPAQAPAPVPVATISADSAAVDVPSRAQAVINVVRTYAALIDQAVILNGNGTTAAQLGDNYAAKYGPRARGEGEAVVNDAARFYGDLNKVLVKGAAGSTDAEIAVIGADGAALKADEQHKFDQTLAKSVPMTPELFLINQMAGMLRPTGKDKQTQLESLQSGDTEDYRKNLQYSWLVKAAHDTNIDVSAGQLPPLLKSLDKDGGDTIQLMKRQLADIGKVTQSGTAAAPAPAQMLLNDAMAVAAKMAMGEKDAVDAVKALKSAGPHSVAAARPSIDHDVFGKAPGPVVGAGRAYS